MRLHNKENNTEMKESIRLQSVSLLWGCKLYKRIKYYFNSHFLLTTLTEQFTASWYQYGWRSMYKKQGIFISSSSTIM